MKAMNHLKENKNCVLVATNVMTRGLDILGVRATIYILEVEKHLSIARQIDCILRKHC